MPADPGGLHSVGHRRPRRPHHAPLLLLHLLLLHSSLCLHRGQVKHVKLQVDGGWPQSIDFKSTQYLNILHVPASKFETFCILAVQDCMMKFRQLLSLKCLIRTDAMLELLKLKNSE